MTPDAQIILELREWKETHCVCSLKWGCVLIWNIRLLFKVTWQLLLDVLGAFVSSSEASCVGRLRKRTEVPKGTRKSLQHWVSWTVLLRANYSLKTLQCCAMGQINVLYVPSCCCAYPRKNWFSRCCAHLSFLVNSFNLLQTKKRLESSVRDGFLIEQRAGSGSLASHWGVLMRNKTFRSCDRSARQGGLLFGK